MPTDRPEEPARPSRIIVPGAETAPPGAAPRIVLPPGASVEPTDDLPEYPRLRPLVIMPIVDQERELLLVSDPLGVIPGQPVLGMGALALLQLLDGSASLNDITAAVMRDSKDLRVGNMVRDFVRQLDELLMLDSPRFHRAYQELRDAYHPLEIRSAALEGHAYPAKPEELKAFLDENFLQAVALRDAAKERVSPPDAVPHALLAPHLDPRRAGATIARAYLEIGAEPREPLRVVVLGTGHTMMGDRFALTRKHFQTPLGRFDCDTAFVDTLATALGEGAYHGELAHRDEHSIEFQALYLRRRLGGRAGASCPSCAAASMACSSRAGPPRSRDQGGARGVRAAEHWHGCARVFVAAVDLRTWRALRPRRRRARRRRAGRSRRSTGPPSTPRAGRRRRRRSTPSPRTAIRRASAASLATYLMLRAPAADAAGPAPAALRYQQSVEPDGWVVTYAAMVWP